MKNIILLVFPKNTESENISAFPWVIVAINMSYYSGSLKPSLGSSVLLQCIR